MPGCLSIRPFAVDDRCIYDRDGIEYHPICRVTGESVCRLCDDCDVVERGELE